MLGYVDCHCHISARDFDKDVEEVIESSKKAGLLALLAVAEHAGEFSKIIELSQRFPGFVFPCLGVHPVQEVSPEQQRGASLQDLDAALPVIQKYKDELVAIGEISLNACMSLVQDSRATGFHPSWQREGVLNEQGIHKAKIVADMINEAH
uniref:TatD DNase domain containing 3 n=1 Tax=Nothobranchius kadleci TaxID=1051664 RepID=A0A1A8D8V4_NOTKA